jgi:hypothetical protein
MDFSPSEADSVLATAAGILARKGATREVAVLANGDPSFDPIDTQWSGDSTQWSLDIVVPRHIYEQIRDERSQLEKAILGELEDIFRRYRNDWVASVTIHPQLSGNKDWKEDAKAWLRGDLVTNQGRARSNNIAALEHDGLLFRSKPEINLYDALKQSGNPIAPLPVFVRGGKEFQRIEPDFLIVRRGLLMVVEVDGDSFHTESPADASARLELLSSHGIDVMRVKADDCSTPANASLCAQRVIDYMDKLKTSR